MGDPYRMTRQDLQERAGLNLVQAYREQTWRVDGGVVVDLDGVTCYLNPDPAEVDFSGAFRTDPDLDAGEAIDRAVAFFAGHDHGFTMWSVGDDLGALDRAAADRSLERVADRWIMYHDRPPKPPDGPRSEYQQLVDRIRLLLVQERTEPEPGVELRRVVDEAGRRDFVHVVSGAFGGDRSRSAFERTYATVDSVCWPGIAAVVGYLDDEPVASAIVYVSHGIGCVTWVGTLPAVRRRGHGTYCTMAASALGFGMGADAAAGPASDVGTMVYEKMGAEPTTRHRWYVWTPA